MPHHLFIIAQLPAHNTAAQYRCLAAFEHKYLRGYRALLVCRMFLSAVQDNAPDIQKELVNLSSVSIHEDCLAHYSTDLLRRALEWDIEKGMNEHIATLSPQVRHQRGLLRNDHGVSVFDITVPCQPRYCLLNIGRLKGVETDSVPVKAPMSAAQYADAYRQTKFRLDSLGDENLQLWIQDLNTEFEMIDSSTLIQVWPKDGYDHHSGGQITWAPPLRRIFPPVPPLSSFAIRAALLFLLDCDDVSALLQSPLPLHIYPIIRETLAEQPRLCRSATALLIQVLKADSTISCRLDLSMFALSPLQVIQLVASFPETAILDLSTNDRIEAETVKAIGHRLPDLQLLILCNHGSASVDDLDALVNRDHTPFPFAVQFGQVDQLGSGCLYTAF